MEPSHFKTGFISRRLNLVRHGAYDAELGNYMEWVLPGGRRKRRLEPVAGVRSCAPPEDTSGKLRFPPKGAVILAMTRFLPDAFG